jgi:hypothetical protein
MMNLTKRINDNFYNDEFEIIIIEGRNGVGKTTYANKGIAEVYSVDGIHRNWDIPLFKKHLGFHPMNVLKAWKNIKIRDKAYHWDDSGQWLHSLDFHDPFVKEIGKYPQTARTDWGVLMFSCIDADDIIKKIRGFRSLIKVRITKHSSIDQPYRRIATAKHPEKDWYGNIFWIDDWTEEFNCHVPDSFYSWYNPYRRKYSVLAKKLAYKKAKEDKDIMGTIRESKL